MTTETLIASLTIGADNGVELDDENYIDWSTRDGERFRFEVRGEDGTTAMWMTRDEMRALHTQLTLTLLADQT